MASSQLSTCRYCGKKIIRRGEKRHWSSCPKRNSSQPCEHCEQSVEVKGMQEHLRSCEARVRTKKIECTICGTPVHPSSLKRHYKSEICSKLSTKMTETETNPMPEKAQHSSTNPSVAVPINPTLAIAIPQSPVERIKYLQTHHNFPACHVDSNFVLITSPVDNMVDWTRPMLLDPESCWRKHYSSHDFFHEMHLRLIKDKDNGEVRQNGELVPQRHRSEAISGAFHQAMSPVPDNHNLYSIMNVTLSSKFYQLQPSQALQSRLRIVADEQIPVLMNFAPAGVSVDIHIGIFSLFPLYTLQLTDTTIDQNRHGISQSLGSSVRIWLLYPPSSHNLSIFTSSCGEDGRLTKASGDLEHGHFVIQYKR